LQDSGDISVARLVSSVSEYLPK